MNLNVNGLRQKHATKHDNCLHWWAGTHACKWYNTPQVGIGVNVVIKRVLRVYANDSPGNDREDAGILCRRGSARACSRNEQQHQTDPCRQRPGGTSDQWLQPTEGNKGMPAWQLITASSETPFHRVTATQKSCLITACLHLLQGFSVESSSGFCGCMDCPVENETASMILWISGHSMENT